MEEIIGLPGDVPQFLSESDFYFPLMSPEKTHLDSAALMEKYDQRSSSPQLLRVEYEVTEINTKRVLLQETIPISQIRKEREFKEKR